MKVIAWFIIYWLWWTLCLRRNEFHPSLNVSSLNRKDWQIVIALRSLAHELDKGSEEVKNV